MLELLGTVQPPAAPEAAAAPVDCFTPERLLLIARTLLNHKGDPHLDGRIPVMTTPDRYSPAAG